jgi:multimeric flavodoxin WrbA
MRRLLIVWHSATGGTALMAQAAAAAARAEPDIDVKLRRASEAGAADVLSAEGYLFATPETLGSMAGMMKDFFDRTYYPALDQVNGRPVALMVCAGSDGSGAIRQMQRICTGLRLREVTPPLVINTAAQTPERILAPKDIGADDLARCAEIGAALAAGLAAGIL